MKTLDLWYYSLGLQELFPEGTDPKLLKRAAKRIEKEKAKSRGEELFSNLTEHKGGKIHRGLFRKF